VWKILLIKNCRSVLMLGSLLGKTRITTHHDGGVINNS
jgi:hypothetical protein